MRTYLVEIKVDDPYPKRFEERIPASHIGLAMKRAVEKVRKAHFARRKITSITAKATLL